MFGRRRFKPAVAAAVGSPKPVKDAPKTPEGPSADVDESSRQSSCSQASTVGAESSCSSQQSRDTLPAEVVASPSAEETNAESPARKDDVPSAEKMTAKTLEPTAGSRRLRGKTKPNLATVTAKSKPALTEVKTKPSPSVAKPVSEKEDISVKHKVPDTEKTVVLPGARQEQTDGGGKAIEGSPENPVPPKEAPVVQQTDSPGLSGETSVSATAAVTPTDFSGQLLEKPISPPSESPATEPELLPDPPSKSVTVTRSEMEKPRLMESRTNSSCDIVERISSRLSASSGSSYGQDETRCSAKKKQAEKNDKNASRKEDTLTAAKVRSRFPKVRPNIRARATDVGDRTTDTEDADVGPKKKFTGTEELDRSTFTMADLIFWNPKNGSKLESALDGKKTEVVRDKESVVRTKVKLPEPISKKEDLAAPQIRIGADGKIIIDEASLNVEQSRADETSHEVVQETNRRITSASFRKKGFYARGRAWHSKETEKFYKVLSATGLDFSLMAEFFPKRDRVELRMKYKREDIMNRPKLDDALRRRDPLDSSLYNLLDSDGESDEEEEEEAASSDEGESSLPELGPTKDDIVSELVSEVVEESRATSRLDDLVDNVVDQAMDADARLSYTINAVATSKPKYSGRGRGRPRGRGRGWGSPDLSGNKLPKKCEDPMGDRFDTDWASNEVIRDSPPSEVPEDDEIWIENMLKQTRSGRKPKKRQLQEEQPEPESVPNNPKRQQTGKTAAMFAAYTQQRPPSVTIGTSPFVPSPKGPTVAPSPSAPRIASSPNASTFAPSSLYAKVQSDLSAATTPKVSTMPVYAVAAKPNIPVIRPVYQAQYPTEVPSSPFNPTTSRPIGQNQQGAATSVFAIPAHSAIPTASNLNPVIPAAPSHYPLTPSALNSNPVIGSASNANHGVPNLANLNPVMATPSTPNAIPTTVNPSPGPTPVGQIVDLPNLLAQVAQNPTASSVIALPANAHSVQLLPLNSAGGTGGHILMVHEKSATPGHPDLIHLYMLSSVVEAPSNAPVGPPTTQQPTLEGQSVMETITLDETVDTAAGSEITEASMEPESSYVDTSCVDPSYDASTPSPLSVSSLDVDVEFLANSSFKSSQDTSLAELSTLNNPLITIGNEMPTINASETVRLLAFDEAKKPDR